MAINFPSFQSTGIVYQKEQQYKNGPNCVCEKKVSVVKKDKQSREILEDFIEKRVRECT